MDQDHVLWLAKYPTVNTQARKLEAALRRVEIWTSRTCALQTVALLRNVVGTCKWHSAGELIARLKWLGRRLSSAAPRQRTVGNAVRRILWMIREDAAELSARSQGGGRWQQRSLQDVLAAQDHDTVELEELPGELKQSVMEQILEFYDEIENVHEPIIEQLVRHIPSQQVVLTILDLTDDDHGQIVAKACQNCTEVLLVICQDAKSKDHDTLSSDNTIMSPLLTTLPNVTLIPDTNIVAVMPRVDAVILPARSVAGDGSLLASPASFIVALAAKNYNRPVLAIVGLYKLCLGHQHNPFDAALHDSDPNSILPYADLPSDPSRDPDAVFRRVSTPPSPCAPADNIESSSNNVTSLDVPNPLFDHVPANLLDLYITNTGAHQPSYVGRLLSDLYSPLDSSL
mmetsp:Transcript_6952/g.9743  ORF Transcript_6952/g.9743 Transcript_6952/m.9743 type:complete len:400 (-) Transcript_6952:128-1327(-)